LNFLEIITPKGEKLIFEMVRIFLIGFMGCGKTVTGKLLAQKTGLQWLDTDNLIERRYRKTITEIFEIFGEKKFREIEHQTVLELTELQNIIVSCGGGLPCFYDNMQIMKNAGTTIYLKELPENLFQRLSKGKNSRILIRDKSEAELKAYISDTLKQREQFYNQADFTINVAENLTHTDEILKRFF
jgi:shikimate kinase